MTPVYPSRDTQSAVFTLPSIRKHIGATCGSSAAAFFRVTQDQAYSITRGWPKPIHWPHSEPVSEASIDSLLWAVAERVTSHSFHSL